MKIFGRKSTEPPERRHVVASGRTAPYAYHARRSNEPSALGRQILREALQVRTAQRAAHYGLQRFGLIALVIAAILASGNLVGLSSTPKVLPISTLPTGFLHSMADYQQAADRLFQGSLLNRNKLTIDANGIGMSMLKQFPELSVATVSLPLVGQQPILFIAQADPALVLTTTDGHSYIVDSTGRTIGTVAVSNLTTQHLLHVIDQSGSVIRVGQPALAADAVAFLGTVQYELTHKSLAISTVVLPAASNEADVYLVGQPYFVKFNTATDDALLQAGAFLAVQHSLVGRGVVPAQYIDVRLQGRAYYK